jgi:hypothetical protein
MALTAGEVEALRFHLGYGNVDILALPYTNDGFWFTFNTIVASYLTTGTETSSTTAITAGATVVVTPAAMTGIDVYSQLVVDVAEQAELVTVKAVTSTTFTAHFAKSHAVSGYPIATMSGLSRLRMLIHDADAAWKALSDLTIAKTAGLKSVDQDSVVWFGGGSVMSDRRRHYDGIVASISSLVRVPVNGACARSTSMEAY